MKPPTTHLTRRHALRLGTAAATLPLVHIRTAAAGKLALAFWDHWVPGRNDVMSKQISAFPPFASMQDFNIWEEVGPPRGVIYHYPVRASDHAQADVAGAPVPPPIAVQIYNSGIMPLMLARLFTGNTITETIGWAEEQLGAFVR